MNGRYFGMLKMDNDYISMHNAGILEGGYLITRGSPELQRIVPGCKTNLAHRPNHEIKTPHYALVP